MTPYELALCIESHAEKHEAEMKDKLSLVWLGEYYHRTKRLPNLQDELKKISGNNKKGMTNDEMLAMVKRLNREFGGSVVNSPENKKGGN